MHVAVPPRDSGSESASSASSSSSSDGSDGGLSDGGESVFSDTEYQRLREASAWKSAIMEVEGNLVAARSVLESPSCPASTQPPATSQLSECCQPRTDRSAAADGLQRDEHSKPRRDAP